MWGQSPRNAHFTGSAHIASFTPLHIFPSFRMRILYHLRWRFAAHQGILGSDKHGVFIWLSASTRFQPDTLLKLSPPCQPDGPGAGTLPTIPSIQRLRAPPPMARRPVGTLREHGGRDPGVMPRPLAANRPPALRHCSPPFIMIRTSFAGWRYRSFFTCSVVRSGCRAHIHIPNDRATIIAAMTFSSQRRVNASSW